MPSNQLGGTAVTVLSFVFSLSPWWPFLGNPSPFPSALPLFPVPSERFGLNVGGASEGDDTVALNNRLEERFVLLS
jgi:hypothetical protein